MKDGSTARDAYQHALSVVRDKKPELEKNFVKNIGFGVGYDPVLELYIY
jgi:nucleosome binding factor SPN SPT16 subunit